MNKLAILAAAAATTMAFGAAGAYAQAGGDFAKVDANHDNVVTMDEAMGPYPTLTQDIFNKADANGDGKLDAGEFGSLEGLLGNLQSSEGASQITPSAPADASSSSGGGNGGSSSSAAM